MKNRKYKELEPKEPVPDVLELFEDLGVAIYANRTEDALNLHEQIGKLLDDEFIRKDEAVEYVTDNYSGVWG